MKHLDPSRGVAIFTDGSASTADRSGGWAYVAVDAFGHEHHESGAASDTTISRMEIQAALEGLTRLHEIHGPSEVLMYSDSQYVVLGSIDRTRKRLVNVDLWVELDKACGLHSVVEWEHVKGHEGNHYNEMADELAGKARKNG